ncbi:NAD(P)H-dependent oxidoreductase [Granulicella arctica]|uniref:NAD(P)H dehydrogenase (Quinone) n=1 Tax=Granulicella arctica TaxID=940613 RepID=A0A7Y9PF69_9BACT|nr:NAD(P)H-dependent oxidoreductase [Granulicella arctica]NYF78570.1 NAD(P)H dehydrogenase (quinone) [Granulicella arctica]
MNVLIVAAIQEPKNFNAAMLAVAREALTAQGHSVQISDLYDMGFDPVSDRRNFLTSKDPSYLKQQVEEVYAFEQNGFESFLQGEMDKLLWCDLLIFQFPLWWFGLPAILKGWVDRVFAMGVAYGYGRHYDKGVFKGKRAMVVTTTGGPEVSYLPGGAYGEMDVILFPIQHGIFAFCGFDVLAPFVAWSPAHGSTEDRNQTLDRYRERLHLLDGEQPLTFERFKAAPRISENTNALT